MCVTVFIDILQGPFARYLQISQELGEAIWHHSKLVQQAFNAQLAYLQLVSESAPPSNQNELANLLKPTSDHIVAVQDFRGKHRSSPFFNHLSAISESIPALAWVIVNTDPSPYVKYMNESGQFYAYRVLKDWKRKDHRHADWVKAWVQTLTDLQEFVKKYHENGLVWGEKTGPLILASSSPNVNFSTIGAGDANLFDQIHLDLKKGRGDDVEMKKNISSKKDIALSQTSHCNHAEKSPNFVRDGKKWLIEYQKGNHNLLVDETQMNNVVYLYKCTDSFATIKGKINSIVVDSCKKTSVVFDSLLSSIEFINCESVQMQVFGKVPTISVDKTDGCQIYLSPESLGVEIVSSKSSEMNVLIPKDNDDYEYMECPIPEQFKTTVTSNKLLSTSIVENKC